MRWLGVASVAAVLAMTVGSTGASSQRAVPSVTPGPVCRHYSVRARIAGTTVCLRDTQKCRARLAREYGRYGFDCRFGSLVATWKRLSRPLHIPQLSAGTACPISPAASGIDFRSHNVGTGIGPGPVFPAPFSPDAPQQLNDFSVPADWHGGKHAFVTLSSYSG